jgi:formylglycine-generating enzyme required for sulfatase activity
MNLTNQYIANPKIKFVNIMSLDCYQSKTSRSKIRLDSSRTILNEIIQALSKITFKIDDITFDMICVPKGQFKIKLHEYDSSTDDDDDDYDEDSSYDETKDVLVDHLISMRKKFMLGETEITQDLFTHVMGFNESSFQAKNALNWENSSKRPVENVTWYDALIFCNKLSVLLNLKPCYSITNARKSQWWIPNIVSAEVTTNPRSNGFRLPLDKEWLHAAKAGSGNEYAGTNEPNDVGERAWFDVNGNGETHLVKGKKPNEWGFYDMNGNVWEWCWDEDTIYNDCKVIRGGGFGSQISDLKFGSPSPIKPNKFGNTIGFRIAKNIR